MHACMHHFDLHRERLINFTIDDDSFGLYIFYGRSIYYAVKRGEGDYHMYYA